jgi:hypothetical protein
VGVSKFSQLGFLRFWGPITLRENLQLRWGLKKSCSFCRELFNDISHAICMQGNWGDSWLLVVGSQIVNLTPDLSFSHNLCLQCPNGSYEPILDIYSSKAFPWYKKLFNQMGFDTYNCSLKIWEFTKTPTPKVGVHLRVWRFILSHSLTLLGAWYVISGLPF